MRGDIGQPPHPATVADGEGGPGQQGRQSATQPDQRGRTALRRRAAADTGLLNKVCAGVDKDTFWYVLIARLVVTVPFHMINVAAGVMAAPLRPYVIATFVGLLPAHIIYCWIGDSLHEVLITNPNPDIRSLFAEFFWPLMGVAFLSMLLPLLLKLGQTLRGRRRTEAS